MSKFRQKLLGMAMLAAATAEGNNIVAPMERPRGFTEQHNSLQQTKRQRKTRKNKRRTASRMRALNRVK